MAVTVKHILALVEEQAPASLALAWDRVGLQVGHPEQEVKTLVVALEPSEAVLQGAVEAGAQMVLTHHPVLFQPLECLRLDTPTGRLLSLALKHNLALAAAHTNLDIAEHGLNDFLARTLELNQIQVLQETQADSWYKLAVFVPIGYEDQVRQALFDDRTGVIGRYAHCSFAARGEGTYRPLAGAQPFRGEVTVLSRASESRLEILVPESRVAAVIERLRAAHPYEEVAYDLYPLKNPGRSLGLGRVGEWPEARPWPQVVQHLKTLFQVSIIKAVGQPPEMVKKVALCGGSGGDLIEAAWKQGAELYLSGDIRYHQAVPWALESMAILDLGHYATESIFMPAWGQKLQERLDQEGMPVKVIIDAWGQDPFHYL
ncbi:MAG: Nif3-like dinuclear metal center hexameric protein [Deltaproteobacteria bacterium]|nr:Nif3-like dinuclear metal center hexameric protein [Deltaproteobacteria bacterium]